MKPISETIFSFSCDGATASPPKPSHERCSAKDLKLPEAWLSDAIFREPELVIGPCRAAGLTDDDWYPWQREFQTDVGNIDVLLISSQGRLAVVETKLASNPESRRKVLAQALDYLAHLYDAIKTTGIKVPTDDAGEVIAELDDIRATVDQGDVLVIIASDEIDPRVARLGRTLLADHLVKQWDLALVDLALYRPPGADINTILIVPTLRGVVESEARQVVRVIVEGHNPRATVEVERVSVDVGTPVRQKWDEEQYFESLGAWGAPIEVQKLARDLRELGDRFPESVTFNWGTGKKGTMVLKRNGGGLIEVRASGALRFRPNKFSRALGEQTAAAYLQGLEKLAPSAMKMGYPRVPKEEAAKVASAMFDLVTKTLEAAEPGQ